MVLWISIDILSDLFEIAKSHQACPPISAKPELGHHQREATDCDFDGQDVISNGQDVISNGQDVIANCQDVFSND
jgi:hypothetical protein